MKRRGPRRQASTRRSTLDLRLLTLAQLWNDARTEPRANRHPSAKLRLAKDITARLTQKGVHRRLAGRLAHLISHTLDARGADIQALMDNAVRFAQSLNRNEAGE